MTINSNTRKAGPFVGNNVTTTFPFTFKVFAAADLLVVRVNTTTNVETTLVLGTDYSVTLNAEQNSSPGGNVVLTSALATGNNMIITSDLGNLQPTDLTNQGGFYPEVINDALDRATIQIQQLQEGVARRAVQPGGGGGGGGRQDSIHDAHPVRRRRLWVGVVLSLALLKRPLGKRPGSEIGAITGLRERFKAGRGVVGYILFP